MINQNSVSFVEDEQTKREVNKDCDKLITELSGIKLRVAAIKGKTAYHGPSTDAELFIDKAILRLQHQKR